MAQFRTASPAEIIARIEQIEASNKRNVLSPRSLHTGGEGPTTAASDALGDILQALWMMAWAEQHGQPYNGDATNALNRAKLRIERAENDIARANALVTA